MAKEKLKNFVITNKKIFVILVAILAIFLVVSLVAYADNNDEYAVEIKDDGSANIAQDGMSSITKKIVEDTSKSLTYEVKVNNLNDATVVPEVAIVVDNSKSVDKNDVDVKVKEKATQLIRELLNENPRVKISLADNTGLKVSMNRASLSTYVSAINNMSYNNEKSVGKGIEFATASYTGNSNTKKHLIIISDATDSIKNILESNIDDGIRIYAILTNITNNEYDNKDLNLAKVMMIGGTEDFSDIYNSINNSLANVRITDVFAQETLNYFNFSVISKENDVVVTQNSLGYTLECPAIQPRESRTLKFKLDLKTDAAIDERRTYTTLNTSDNMKMEYNDSEGQMQAYDMTVSPTYVICKKYSLTIEAVSEKSDKLPIADLSVSVVGKVTDSDTEGNEITKIIYNKTLTTDSNGKIKIDGLKTLGNITFEITPKVNQFGYVETPATQIIVHNNPSESGIWAESDMTTPEVDNVTRNINVKLPILVQTFSIDVETMDINNENIKLGNIEYRLIQPKLNSKYDMEALYETADNNGNLTFKPAIMTKDGTYEYILSQLSEQDGYEPMGNVTLLVTFENGNVTKFIKKYNDKVEAERISAQKAKVKVGNVAKKDETFFLQMNVSDKTNNSIKLIDVSYDIEVTRVDSTGTQVTSQILNQITDEDGRIELEIPGTGNIQLKITEVDQKPGYLPDTQVKEIIFFRNNGTVQYITKTNPLDVDAVADKEKNAVIVNLQCQPANEQNRVQVNLVDSEEPEVNIPKALLTLTNMTTNKVYTATTNKEGIANFIVPNEEEGTYEYKVEMASTKIYGYTVDNTNLATVAIKYNSKKHIYEVTQSSTTVPLIETNYEKMLEDKYEYDTAKIKIGLVPDRTDSYDLKINLLDSENSKPIKDAQYSIDIVSEENDKELRGRKTDEGGNITTRIIGGDNVTIKIRQTYSTQGYIINDQEQIIELRKAESGYEIINQEPYIYDPANGQNIGAEIVGEELIYHDINEKKSGADTIMNLYINKKDINDYLVAGVKVVLSSPTLVDSEGKNLDEPYDYVDPATGETKQINYRETDNNGYLELLGIQVDGENLNNGERVDYLYTYEVDENGNKKANTDMTFKLIFRYNVEKNIIEITNVEATWGNRLMKKKDFSGYESSKAYESNVYLDLYTNYDDVGNFSLDLKKVNKDGTVLPGSKYDVTVTRLDGTRLIRKDIEVGDNVEFEGFTVAVGTNIEITEKTAPIGYDINNYTEILTVEAIDELTGDATVKLETGGYENARANIASKQTLVMSDGSYKTCITLELIDYETSTFKFGILAQDATALESLPIKDYVFKISSNQGSEITTNATGEDGRVSTLIGGNYEIDGYEVVYTIDTVRTANYYKKLVSPIKVKVVFDAEGKVNATATDLANTGNTGYGSVWSIEATNTVGGNDIDIIINVDPQDPLVVNIQSVDIASGTQLTNVQYKIKPSINISSEGTTKINVGYVIPNGIQTYELNPINTIERYMPLQDMRFKVVYDEDGNIAKLPESLTEGLTAVSYTGKEITLKVDMMPELPFVIKNTGYFDGLNIANAKFEITSAQNLTKEKLTDKDGQAVLYVDKLEQDTTVRYTVKQLEAGYGYATVEDFQIDVTFDANRNVTNAQIVGDVNKYVNFVEVTVKAPSTTADEGYNGNDKGIINISVKNYPDVQMQIENVDLRDESIKLAGATYKIVSSINTKADAVTTDSNGIGTGRLDKSGYQETVTYTITQVNPSVRYQSLAIPVVIEVDFDNTGYIINTPRIIKRADIATVSIPAYNEITDKFKVNVQIKSNPELAITINKVDTDTGDALGKVDFEVTARIAKSNLANYTEDEIKLLTLNTKDVTEEEYLSQVLDRLKINPEDVATIKQDIGIQNLINELKATGKLTADEENQINACVNNSQKINKIVELNKATKTQVNAKIKEVTNQNVVDKLIAKGTTSQDRVDELLALVKDLVRLDVDNITTDSTGIAIAYMDKTLANKTIEYTIKETKKADGYDWLDEVVIIEITYDAQGKMVSSNPIKVVSGDIDVTNYNADDFTVEATIKNKPSDEVRVHLSVEDVYDSNKKLETAIFDTYLVDTRNSITFSPDDKYRLTLESGSATTTTGLVTAHGEDTETMGIYEEGAGTRVLRLVEKQVPNTYYMGNDSYASVYQSIKYALLINVTFNDEGSITDVNVYNPGGDTNSIGAAADNRYLQVTHTRNTINVTVRYYPMLQIQMQAVDMYTKESLQGQYTIDTTRWGIGLSSSELVSSGYIIPNYRVDINGNEWFGTTYSAKYTTDSSITTIEDANLMGILPAEADTFKENVNPDKKERVLYIYENAEPNSPMQYQTYLPRYIGHPYNYLLAKIKVKYDDIGRLTDVEVLETISNNNIKDGFFTSLKATVNDYTIQIKVEYAPITTITAKVVDEVSGAELAGVRIDPYIDGNFSTKTSYEYRTVLYYTTGSNGQTNWTYWGANVANAQNRYILDTYTVGQGYDGYFDPQNIILDVAYDDNGRIASVEPKSTDEFGDVNATDISWKDNNLNVTIKYSRKFKVKLNKVDYYDSNTKLNAGFKVLSSKGTMKTFNSDSGTTLGKIYAGEQVKYTLSETVIPTGYIPITNLEILVDFDKDGTVKSATSTSEYYDLLKVAPVDEKTNKFIKTDVEANIKNKPRFDVNVDLSDEFYSAFKLAGGIFTVTNSKGDVDSGGVQTDANGTLTTYVGTVYPNEEVTYTVKQTNTIAGYYDNTTVMEFKVKFNENGKIETYTVTSGGEVMQINPTKHVGTKAITLNITNKPKDVKLGIEKYDDLTKNEMEDVHFKVKTEVVGGATSETNNIVTNANGKVVSVVDNFTSQSANKVVKYIISEIEAANSYRKIQDVVLQVTYKEDGTLYLYDVLSNPNNVKVEVATNKQLKYIEDTPVHIKLSIPNDNAYDLIIKNEDRNYAGLGIQGTQYDLTINGVVTNVPQTDSNGITKLEKLTQSGDLEFAIAEKTIGIGYREDTNNTAVIKINKSTGEYALTLTDNSNPTNADVAIDEEHGTITVTFKNETKLELTMQNKDINTEDLLQGAVFEITSEEVDTSGNTVAGTQRTITTIANNTTDMEGLLYFDLGTSYQNKILKYTFTQITPATGYTLILPITVTVKFDTYGKIIKMEDDSVRATERILSSKNPHHIFVSIGNGVLDPKYTVKIVTEDSKSQSRINGSIFQVEALEKDTGATNTSITGTTRNESTVLAGNNYVTEKGALRVTGITAENNVKINISQIETATGYIYGSNLTAGTVEINAEFIVVGSNLEKDVNLSLIDDGGFDVQIDNVNREITIKVLNDPDMMFEITKINADAKEGEDNKIQGAKFTITSAIEENGNITEVGTETTTKETDDKGYTETSVGSPYAGKTVIYTIKEEKLEGYNQLDDIILKVIYDAKGNVMDYKILSDEKDVAIQADSTKTISKRVIGESDIPGLVEISATTITIPTGRQSRILQLIVNNTRESLENDYQIKVEKHHSSPEYPANIPGVMYEITVMQEYGKETTTWTDITNEEGIIVSPYFSGYGYITVELREISAPEGYEIDNKVKTTRFYRYQKSGEMKLISSDVEFETDEEFTIATLKPTNNRIAGKYDIVINKLDKNSREFITESSAKIEINMLEEYEVSTETTDETTGNPIETIEKIEVRTPILEEETNGKGRIVADAIETPSKPGIYKFYLKETNAPKGYNAIEGEVELDIEFVLDENSHIVIKSATVVNSTDVKVLRVSSQLLKLIVYNEKQNEDSNPDGDDDDNIVLKDNQFGFRINKVDEDLVNITTGVTEFTLIDRQTKEIKEFATDTQGEAETQVFDMPKEAGNYKYTINEVTAPEGYKLDTRDIDITLEFKEDSETEKIYLASVKTEGNVVYEQPKAGKLPNKKIKLKVINEDEPYQVIIEKHHEENPDYPTLIPGVDFDVTIEQEYGGNIPTWTDTTNAEGIITSDFYSGYGYITIKIKEKSAPDKYQVDYAEKTIKVYRDKETKKLRIVDSDVGYEFSSDNKIIYLKPTNELIGGIFDMVINKMDKDTNKLISNNPAKLSLYMLREYHQNKTDPVTGDVTEEVTQIKELVIDGKTDDKGRLIGDAILMPSDPGEYTYILEETEAPSGYKGLESEVQFKVKFEFNASNELVITDVNVVSGDGVKILKFKDQLITLAVENEEEFAEGKFTLDITKVDKEENAITTDTAIFKIEDLSTNEVQYVETDSLANVTKKIAMSTAQGIYKYKVTEVKAPEGYVLDRNSIDITITTQKTDDKIVISDIQVTGDNVKYANKVADGETPSSTIKLEVTNIEGTNGGDANDKPYTVIINKIDSVTRELIKENATFNVSLVNGEIVNAATNGEGKIIIENVFMPSKEGEYEITLKEIIAPNGYYLDPDTKIAKVTFSGTGDSMVISDIQLDDAHNSNIEIVTAECTEDKIVLNVLNEKEDDDLYVISKKDSAGEDIYDVMKEYAGKQYKVDKPFIDTRVAKSGNNIKVQEFIDNLESNGVMTVWDKDGNQIDPASKVKTGYILKSTKGSKELTFEIVVKGDIDGDGRVRSKDLDMLIKHLAGGANTFTADPIKMRAADIVDDGNGRVRSNDLNEFYKVLAK